MCHEQSEKKCLLFQFVCSHCTHATHLSHYFCDCFKVLSESDQEGSSQWKRMELFERVRCETYLTEWGVCILCAVLIQAFTIYDMLKGESRDSVIKNGKAPWKYILFFLSKDAARQRSVVSARAAGESAGAEGDTLFTLPSGIPLWLLRGCLGEQQPKGERGRKGNVGKGSRSKCLNVCLCFKKVLFSTTI